MSFPHTHPPVNQGLRLRMRETLAYKNSIITACYPFEKLGQAQNFILDQIMLQ